MAHIGLLSCVSKKRKAAVVAKDLYISPLFNKSRRYVEQLCDSWFILSAKYGLVDPEDVIAPYEETLNKKSQPERKKWAEKVWGRLQKRLKPNDTVTILAGEKYRANLLPYLEGLGCQINIPMKGLGIGRQLQWLSHKAKQPNRDRDVEHLYSSLSLLENGLQGKRLLSECTGTQKWPQSGVYLFFEHGENRTRSTKQRIVRVGTHGVSRGSKATLWNRLRTHKGTSQGYGNHRGSIFRLHVGTALSCKNPRLRISSWGKGQTADANVRKKEARLELEVSKHIGSMRILWLSIEDESGPYSDRAYIERNLIGLLAGKTGPIDLPSNNWLGQYSPREQIRTSGLWNLAHLSYKYSPEFLDVLDEYILITIGSKHQPSGSIAPANWYNSQHRDDTYNQLSLFEE